MKHSGFGRIALAVMAPFLILSAPFVNFIAVRGYGFGHPEVLIVFGFLSVPAAVIAAIAALRPDTLRPAVRGEPIVCTPEDAFRCFMGTGIEVLAAGNCLLMKEDQDQALARDYKDAFEMD